MDPPQPSQNQPKSTLFSNSDGSPLRVFTQVADIIGRPKIIKDLKSNGAAIASAPEDAQIMLVDPQTDQGLQFISDWSGDSNKAILSHSWVRKSLAEGKPLLESEQWGGCLAHDDGQPLDADEMKSPLPTPRVTPDDKHQSLSDNASATRQPPIRARRHIDREDTSLPPPSPSPATSASVFSPPVDAHISYPSMALQNPASGNMANSMPPPMGMNPFQVLTALSMMPMAQANYQSSEFQLALADAMRNAAQFSAGQPYFPSQMQPMNGNNLAFPMQNPPLPYPDAPPSTFEASSSRHRRRDSLVSPSPPLEPSFSRYASSPEGSEPLRHSTNGKSKARAHSPSNKRRKVSSSSANGNSDTFAAGSGSLGSSHSQNKIFTTDYGNELKFFVQIETHRRIEVVTGIKKNGGKIVSDVSKADYAILSQGNKPKDFNEHLKVAEAAGTIPVQAKFVHECVAQNRLLNASPYLHESAVIRNKRKRTPSVVPVEVESEDEPEETPEQKQKRLERNKRQSDRRRQVRLEKKEGNKPVSYKTEASSSKVAKVASPATKHSSWSGETSGPRTPTPPPESKRQLWGMGYKFSTEENEFALQYAKILIDRDHQISLNAVAGAIHKKASICLPHHSLPSWRTHFATIATEFDTWRKRSGIAYRKAQSQKEAIAAGTPSAPATPATPATEPWVNVNTDTNELPFAGASSLPETVQRISPDLDDDLNAIARFFADGNDSNPDEPEHMVFARLTAQSTCKTEAHWEVFYEKHEAEVNRRFKAFTGDA